MSNRFGWWDIQEGPEQQMICRDTRERVVMVGELEEPWLGQAVSKHPELPQDCWKRFEYRHSEFWFPLIVNWPSESGNVLVDHNLSSTLWRHETGAQTEVPAFGGWVRVDDMVTDAFWCWPGILEAIQAGDHHRGISALGGWSNGEWRRDFRTFEHIGPRIDYSSEAYRPVFPGPQGPYALARHTEYDWIGTSGPTEKLHQQWSASVVPLPKMQSPDFVRQFSDRQQFARTLRGLPVDAPTGTRWQFQLGGNGAVLADYRKSLETAGQGDRPVRLFGRCLADGRGLCAQSHDKTQVISFFQPRALKYEFRFFSLELDWIFWCLFRPVVDWSHSRVGYYFSLQPESRSTQLYGRASEQKHELSLDLAGRLSRKFTDALLTWKGAVGVQSGWPKDADFQDDPDEILEPVESLSSIVSHLAGRRVMDRARLAGFV